MVEPSSQPPYTDQTQRTESATFDLEADDMPTLLAIMSKLRDRQSGCPWDAEQTFESIVPYTLEEAYEVADAVARNDMDDLCDELGDVLLQVVFHAQMAQEAGHFSFDDVVAGICQKMIRRHPHVFGDVDRDDAQAVKRRWEEIKIQEKDERRAKRVARGEPITAKRPSALDGVPHTLPPLQRAFKLQAKAARVGFDWPTPTAVMTKLREETDEVASELAQSDQDKARLIDEIGDVLFVITNLARKLDIDPGVALESTNRKFVKRFQWVESNLQGTQTPVGQADLSTMEAAWTKAKDAVDP